MVASSAADRWVNFPFFLEFGAKLSLRLGRSGVPVHVEDLGRRAKEILGGAMAIKAPLHAERLSLVNHAHFVHRPMTAVAAHAAVHVNGMIEVGVIRETMDLNPRDGLTALPTLTHGSETGAVRQDLALTVAIDAGLGGGEIGVSGNLDKTMAIAAIHSELLHMKGVGEGDGLVGLVAYPGVLRGKIVPDAERDGPTDDQSAHQKLERKPIGPSREKIRHREWFNARMEEFAGLNRVETRRLKARNLDQKSSSPLVVHRGSLELRNSEEKLILNSGTQEHE
jgi:hypothetical protein